MAEPTAEQTAEQKAAQEKTTPAEPRGFGERTRGLSGEYAHEQGWGLNEAERTHQTPEPQDIDGGNDYEYGAEDFGDEPVNVALDRSDREGRGELLQNQPTPPSEPASDTGAQASQNIRKEELHGA